MATKDEPISRRMQLVAPNKTPRSLLTGFAEGCVHERGDIGWRGWDEGRYWRWGGSGGRGGGVLIGGMEKVGMRVRGFKRRERVYTSSLTTFLVWEFAVERSCMW
jgi:hypothetical protein